MFVFCRVEFIYQVKNHKTLKMLKYINRAAFKATYGRRDTVKLAGKIPFIVNIYAWNYSIISESY